ncbi:unnamed protein product [Caretta caretta]
MNTPKILCSGRGRLSLAQYPRGQLGGGTQTEESVFPPQSLGFRDLGLPQGTFAVYYGLMCNLPGGEWGTGPPSSIFLMCSPSPPGPPRPAQRGGVGRMWGPLFGLPWGDLGGPFPTLPGRGG